MRRYYVVTYRYHDDLDEGDLRDLTKKFVEFGTAPGTIAHYERLDGQGGFLVREDTEDVAGAFEITLRYAPWLDFEVFPVTLMEEAFPIIQKLYG